jgi:hypothetical protein
MDKVQKTIGSQCYYHRQNLLESIRLTLFLLAAGGSSLARFLDNSYGKNALTHVVYSVL